MSGAGRSAFALQGIFSKLVAEIPLSRIVGLEVGVFSNSSRHVPVAAANSLMNYYKRFSHQGSSQKGCRQRFRRWRPPPGAFRRASITIEAQITL